MWNVLKMEEVKLVNKIPRIIPNAANRFKQPKHREKSGVSIHIKLFQNRNLEANHAS